LISKDIEKLLFFRATQPKHGGSMACAAKPRDINKVIHRNSGLLPKPPTNQPLARQIAEKSEISRPNERALSGLDGMDGLTYAQPA
jgi:hypothetical protein